MHTLDNPNDHTHVHSAVPRPTSGRSIDDILYMASGPKPSIKKDQRRQREADARGLSLLQSTFCHALALVYLGGIAGGFEGVAGGGQRFEVGAVLLLGLWHGSVLAKHPMAGKHTKGSPQYPQVAISGLSVLMKILGWPRGPPPPSQLTTLDLVHRTGCR